MTEENAEEKKILGTVEAQRIGRIRQFQTLLEWGKQKLSIQLTYY